MTQMTHSCVITQEPTSLCRTHKPIRSVTQDKHTVLFIRSSLAASTVYRKNCQANLKGYLVARTSLADRDSA
ncbi:hypothetical protein PGTUg99_032705 [Puccinia graminis f. sp. tritici]|uniref:Uncharacterized protein n=1 Tax=Puccinia graminis f. sp. tritici TaxID=56615 RepID=A0A5B0S8R4_PUCGR|nr:hypothetical protein PGTUg99_032705 [Puccinia graminis f. sp. tritici]